MVMTLKLQHIIDQSNKKRINWMGSFNIKDGLIVLKKHEILEVEVEVKLENRDRD